MGGGTRNVRVAAPNTIDYRPLRLRPLSIERDHAALPDEIAYSLVGIGIARNGSTDVGSSSPQTRARAA